MRKKVLVLSVFILAILPILLIPTVLTKRLPERPTYVEGTLWYIPRILEMSVFENGETDVVLKTDETGEWEGGFMGVSYDYPCTVVFHDVEFDDGAIVDWDYRHFTGIVNFEGMVNGKYGRLEIRLVGKQFMGDVGLEEWQGTWYILKGEAKLAGIQGFGTWCGLGFTGDGAGEIPYEGWIFFGP